MKLIAELLKSKFPTVDNTLLMKIITATPNPEVATEILCGIYEEPNIGAYERLSKNGNFVYEFISYNKWDNNVYCSYIREIYKGAYFPKGTKIEDVTMETFNDMKISSDEDFTYLSIPTGEFEDKNEYFTLESWVSLLPKPLVLEDFIVS